MKPSMQTTHNPFTSNLFFFLFWTNNEAKDFPRAAIKFTLKFTSHIHNHSISSQFNAFESGVSLLLNYFKKILKLIFLFQKFQNYNLQKWNNLFKQKKWKASWIKLYFTFICAELLSSQDKPGVWVLRTYFGFEKIILSYMGWVHFCKNTYICTQEHMIHKEREWGK